MGKRTRKQTTVTGLTASAPSKTTSVMFLSFKGGVGRSVLATMTRWLTDAILVDLCPYADSSSAAMTREKNWSGGELTKSPILDGSSHSDLELLRAVQFHQGKADIVVDCPCPGMHPKMDVLVGELLRTKGIKVIVPVTIGPRLSSTLARTAHLLTEYLTINPSLEAGVVINNVTLDPLRDEEGEVTYWESPSRISDAVNEVLRSPLKLVGIIRSSEGIAYVDPKELDSPAARDLFSALQVMGVSLGNKPVIPPMGEIYLPAASYVKEMLLNRAELT